MFMDQTENSLKTIGDYRTHEDLEFEEFELESKDGTDQLLEDMFLKGKIYISKDPF